MTLATLPVAHPQERDMSKTSGFSLIEVLVSVVILSVALLGTAGLMSASLRNTNTAYHRSQATFLADEMLDRMRANLTAARNQLYDVDAGNVCAATSGMPQFDCDEWTTSVEQTLPGGQATVDVDPAGVATIVIEWEGEGNSFATESLL
jgi:type IV pilus assembly protein PilV